MSTPVESMLHQFGGQMATFVRNADQRRSHGKLVEETSVVRVMIEKCQ